MKIFIVRSILNILIFYIMARFLFSIFAFMNMAAQNKKAEQEPKRKSEFLEAVNDVEYEIVEDEHCNLKIPKHEAYIAVIDDVEHYFCSWECRQKFLAQRKENKEKEEGLL